MNSLGYIQVNLDASNGRKRAASSVTTDQRSKKTRSKGPQQGEFSSVLFSEFLLKDHARK
jgi:hypothetical protein